MCPSVATAQEKLSSLKVQRSIDAEYESKLVEIIDAIRVLEEQKANISGITEKRLRKLIENKISAMRLQESVEKYIDENQILVNELREATKAKYETFIDYNIKVLENAKGTLTYIKDII